MKRILTRLLALVAVLFLVPPAGVVGWAAWQRLGDPLVLVRAPLPVLTLVESQSYPVDGAGGRRTYTDLIFRAADGRTIRATLSLPRDRPLRNLPIQIILGGLTAGKKSLRHVPDVGANAVVALAYPFDPKVLDEGGALARLRAVRGAAHATPGAVVALARWFGARPWADGKRISLMGFSLGAFFVPAIHHMGRINDLAFGPSVMAYGGAGLTAILRRNLRLKPRWLRAPAGWLAASLLYPLDPAHHLPHLRGAFLIVNGERDRRIPEHSAQMLRALTPEPKTIVILPGKHMAPKRTALMARIARISRDWLVEKGAANDPGAGGR